MTFLLSPLRIVFDYLFGEWNARAVAFGVSLGTLCGLVPKWNLCSLIFIVLFFLLKVNFVSAVLSMLLVSLFAGFLDPFAEQIGAAILEAPVLGSIGERLFSLPLLPWTMLDNTVVLGQFVIGIVLFYPLYKITSAMLVNRVEPQTEAG